MKPFLYAKNETDFDCIGYGQLEECTECYVEEERNGIYEATFKYPSNGALYSKIEIGGFIKIKANDKQDLQIFKIYGSSKVINGIQTFYCEHKTYRLNKIPIGVIKIENKNAQQAMVQIKSESLIQNDFTFESDLDSVLSTEIKEPCSVRRALGGIEGSILDTWGGEYEWDNDKVILHKQRGEYKDIAIAYGRNLISLSKDESEDTVYTAVMPYAKYTKGAEVDEEGNEIAPEEEVTVTIDGDYIVFEGLDIPDDKLNVYIKDFSDEFESENEITKEQLENVCKAWMRDNKLYIPTVNFVVEFAKLEQTENYKDLKNLQSVNLCDYVKIEFEDLGINEYTQVISVKYDSILERYDNIELGDKKSSLSDTVNDLTSGESSIYNQVNKNLIDAIQNATQLITGNKGGHIVLYPGTKPNEILVMDTDNINTAKRVWRWNLNGLGYSKNGYNGDYGLAITMDGQIVADFISAGTLRGVTVITDQNLYVGDTVVLADKLENYGDGYEGTIRIGNENSQTYIIAREANEYPTGTGNKVKYISLVAGSEVGVSVENATVGGKQVYIHAGSVSFLVASDGIYVNGSKGVTGNFRKVQNIDTNNGLVTGVS